MVEEKTVDITPHKQTLHALSFSGYSTVEAIAELVDNCIDARLNEQKLLIEIEIFPDRITIKDDASGMGEEELVNAMKLGSTNKQNKMGEFGLGLKTASIGLGKNVTIITKRKNDSSMYSITWDQDEWIKSYESGKWEQKIKIEPAQKDVHGTTIIIKELKTKYYPNLPSKIREVLGVRFSGFINNDDKILVNGKECESPRTELINEWTKDFDFDIDGHRVHGWIGVMKKRSPGKEHYGFNAYRRGRLIEQHLKVGFNPHPMLSNLFGDLHLDDFSVTHNKRLFLKDNDLWEETAAKLKPIVAPVARNAEQYRSRKEVPKSVIEVVGGLEKFEPIKTAKGAETAAEQLSDEKAGAIEPENEKTSFRIFGKKTEVEYEDLELGDKKPLWKCKPTKSGYKIIVNKDYPLTTSDKEFLNTLALAEALAEERVQKHNDTRSFLEIRDEIIRKLKKSTD